MAGWKDDPAGHFAAELYPKPGSDQGLRAAPHNMGRLYYAFALQPLKTCSNKELLKLVRQKKAILYPWAPQLAHDYPELFERKAET